MYIKLYRKWKKIPVRLYPRCIDFQYIKVTKLKFHISQWMTAGIISSLIFFLYACLHNDSPSKLGPFYCCLNLISWSTQTDPDPWGNDSCYYQLRWFIYIRVQFSSKILQNSVSVCLSLSLSVWVCVSVCVSLSSPPLIFPTFRQMTSLWQHNR